MNSDGNIPEGGLLQSAQWADFLRASGKTVVEISHEDRLVYGVRETLPLVGSYLYVPRLRYIDAGLMERIVSAAQEKGCGWVRVDAASAEDVDVLKADSHGVVRAPHDMQPAENFIIDISGTEEELLAQMKSKTRYNIRLAAKKGVEVESVRNGDEGFDDVFSAFYELIRATSERKGTRPHPREHYLHILTALPSDNASLYIARYDGEIIAANIMTFYNSTATYLHGAAGENHRNVMAPFLLQWQAIQNAKERGCSRYDFGGYYSQTDELGKQGISRFKNGFSPSAVATVSAGSWDVLLSPMRYTAYRILQRVRSIL